MNDHTLKTIADSALDILKEAVLVLYEGTDVRYEGVPYPPRGPVLKPSEIGEKLVIPYV